MQMHQRRLFRHCMQTTEIGGGEEEEEEVSAYRVRSFYSSLSVSFSYAQDGITLKDG